jgi:Protein of unknown function (DUF998)
MERAPGAASAGRSPGIDPTARTLLLGVLVGLGLYVVLDVVAQLLPPHYSPVSQAESDLAVGPYGFLMTINFVNRGVLSLLFVAAFVRVTGGRRIFRSGVVCLTMWGVGAFLLAAFPTDVPAVPLTLSGGIHLVVALVVFFGGAVGIYGLADYFQLDPTVRAAKSFAFPWAIGVVLLLAVELTTELATPGLSRAYGGLFERLFLGAALAWIGAMALFLLRSSRPARPVPVARRVAVTVKDAPASGSSSTRPA